MAITLHTLSGSPFGWKVQLALEHKRLPYEVEYLSVDRGDLKGAWLKAANPHAKLPVLTVDDLTLYESDAIVEYLEHAYPGEGGPLWPEGAAARAVARRMAIEAGAYLYPHVRGLVKLWGAEGPIDLQAAQPHQDAAAALLTLFGDRLYLEFLTGDTAGAADYALFPLVAILNRLDTRRPDQALGTIVPPTLAAWRTRIEALPGYPRTWPPHWGPRP